MTNFEVFLTQIGFLPKPQPVAVKVTVRQETNSDWYKQGKECPF
jgi:hypothetical protein